MSEEIPAELQDIEFAELTNNQQNIWRIRDELNATRKWIRENAVTPTDDFQEEACTHENSYQMRPGLMRCKDCKVIYKENSL